MSEETTDLIQPKTEITTPIPEVVPRAKKKAGRPRKTSTPLKKHEIVAEAPLPKEEVKKGRANEWPTKKAIKIKIHKSNEEGEETVWQLGDAPVLRIRRGVEVIVPYDIKSLLDDAVVEVPRCHIVPGQPIQYYTEKVTRFEYSFFGEYPWEDYLAFLAEERKKK